jgi:hypothetical protein
MAKDLELLDVCYVLLKINKIHPITYRRHEFIWYPEEGMSLLDVITYRPYKKSIVTENPWIISCYDRSIVRVWNSEDLCWEFPNFQTYGASVNKIMMCLLGICQTIPSFVLGNSETIDKLLNSINYEN